MIQIELELNLSTGFEVVTQTLPPYRGESYAVRLAKRIIKRHIRVLSVTVLKDQREVYHKGV